MPIVTDSIIDQATSWHLQQATLDDAGWERFIAWLEADAGHAAAFDQVAAADRLLAEVAIPAAATQTGVTILPFPAPRDRFVPGTRRRTIGWSVGGTAIAAGVAALLMPLALPHAAQGYTVATAPGERRTVRLDDGTAIAMNGDTRLRLDHADTRVATLDRGQATFHVRHDAGKAFTLNVGDVSVRDMGTVFDVARTAGRLDIQVAEGSVLFQPDAEAMVLKRGQALSVSESTHGIARGVVSPETVGGWQQDHLSFTDADLPVVVAAIRRRYGVDVVLEQPLPRRQFTGMVTLSGSADRDIPHLASLIGARWRRSGEQWVLAP